MRLAIMLMLLVMSSFVYSKQLEITCFGDGKVIFHKFVDDVYIYEGFLVAEDKINKYFLVGECVTKYLKK